MKAPVGQPKKNLIDNLRTLFWFHKLKEALGQKLDVKTEELSIYQIEDFFKDTQTKKNVDSKIWYKYATGTTSPRQDRLAATEMKLPGSSYYFNHIFWEILEKPPETHSKILDVYKNLPISVRDGLETGYFTDPTDNQKVYFSKCLEGLLTYCEVLDILTAIYCLYFAEQKNLKLLSHYEFLITLDDNVNIFISYFDYLHPLILDLYYRFLITRSVDTGKLIKLNWIIAPILLNDPYLFKFSNDCRTLLMNNETIFSSVCNFDFSCPHIVVD